MNNTDEIIKKYYEEYPGVEYLAKKYGLKDEYIVVDPFNPERLILNTECFDKYVKAYEFTYGEDGKKFLSDIQAKGDSIEISAALKWIDMHYEAAVKHHLDDMFEKKLNVTIDYTGLPNIIRKAMGHCVFSLDVTQSSDIKAIANYLKDKYSNIIWDDDEYDIYTQLILLNSNPQTKECNNVGLLDCINNTSLDILDVLKTLYNVKSFYEKLNLDRRLVDKLLNTEINNSSKYVSILYDRLKNENKLDIVIASPDKYAFAKELADYKKDNVDNNTDAVNNDIFIPTISTVDSYIPSINASEISDMFVPTVDSEIVNDVEVSLAKYIDADLTDSLVIDTITKDVIETLYSMDKDLYNPEALFYNKEKVISSVFVGLQKNGINATKKKIKENIELAERNIKPITIDINLNDVDADTNTNSDETEINVDPTIITAIFNEVPEAEVKASLQTVYNADKKCSKIILKEYAKFINASMYGTLRDTSTIEKQFTSFCSENGINYTDEFINSLPEMIKDKYKNPVIKKEKTERKGQVFNILKRYSPKTSVKTQKRLYATLAGVGIMSFLFMTTVKVLSPESAADNCTETFERLLHSELLANIFGDIKTYFASIAASIGGGIGYIAKDEQESKSRRM